jgi:tRNA(fMet)-specific endonuclease VapC
MRYLLDTNICIYLIKNRPDSVLRRFRRLKPGDAGISAVTLAELRFGADKSLAAQRNHLALDQFAIALSVAAFDEKAAGEYGRVRAWLEAKGKPIGALDMMIAAHAISLGAVLVTNNEREFRRVQGLRLENWVER